MRYFELSNIEHSSWVPLEELPRLIINADLCLAGPFGNTLQANKVITGKAYQFLSLGKVSIIGKIHEEVGLEMALIV